MLNLFQHPLKNCLPIIQGIPKQVRNDVITQAVVLNLFQHPLCTNFTHCPGDSETSSE